MTRLTAIAAVLGACWSATIADGAPRPKTVDRAVMLELIKSDRALELVDPAVGLVFIDHFNAPGEGVPPPRGELHLCGKAVADFAKASWKPDIGDAIAAASKNKHLSCSSALECAAGGAGEWDPVVRFYFASRADGIALRAVAIADEVLVGDDTVTAERATQRKQIASLSLACKK